MKAAVWYWVHGSISVYVDDVEDAIRVVRGMSDDEDCAPAGVQYEDGTYNEWRADPIVKRQDDEAYAQMTAEMDAVRLQAPRPVFEVVAPFTGKDGGRLTARVWDEPPPSWVGDVKRVGR